MKHHESSIITHHPAINTPMFTNEAPSISGALHQHPNSAAGSPHLVFGWKRQSCGTPQESKLGSGGTRWAPVTSYKLGYKPYNW